MKLTAKLLGIGLSLLSVQTLLATADDAIPRIKAEAARQHVGSKVEVVMQVQAAKNAEKRKTVFLDSEANFQDDKNLGIAISEQGQTELKQQRGIADAAEFYRNKQIRVVGIVELEEDRVYIKVHAAEQLDLHSDPTP